MRARSKAFTPVRIGLGSVVSGLAPGRLISLDQQSPGTYGRTSSGFLKKKNYYYLNVKVFLRVKQLEKCTQKRKFPVMKGIIETA